MVESSHFTLSQDTEGNPIEVFHNAYALEKETVKSIFTLQFENAQYQPIEVLLKRFEPCGGPLVLHPRTIYELSQATPDEQEQFFENVIQNLSTTEKMIITHNPISVFQAKKTPTSSEATSF